MIRLFRNCRVSESVIRYIVMSYGTRRWNSASKQPAGLSAFSCWEKEGVPTTIVRINCSVVLWLYVVAKARFSSPSIKNRRVRFPTV